MKKAVVFLICSSVFGAAFGESRYVTDQFKVSVRATEGTGGRSLMTLQSGTPLQVVNTNKNSGYSLVRVEGVEGYVATDRLMDEPGARDQLAEMSKRIKELQQSPEKLGAKLSSLQKQYEALQSAHKELRQIKQELDRDLTELRRTSANAVNLANERNELRKTVTALTRQTEDLQAENEGLTKQATKNWIMIGGAVALVGVVLGLILPYLRFRRRSSSWQTL